MPQPASIRADQAAQIEAAIAALVRNPKLGGPVAAEPKVRFST